MSTDRAVAALLSLTRPLASERRGGVLGTALENLKLTVRARAAVVFRRHPGELVIAADEGSWQNEDALAERVHHSAERAAEKRKSVWDSPMAASASIPHVLAAPLLYQRDVLGVLVAVLEERSSDVEDFVELTANVLGLALEVDASREREAETRAELVGTGRMAVLGVLLGTLAQELHGPIHAILVQGDERRQLLARLEQLSRDEPVLAAIAGELTVLAREVDSAVGRLRGTVDRVLSASRRDGSPEVLDLSDPVRDVVELCRPDFVRRGIQVSLALTEGAAVRGRREELGQVAMNLLRNAADACEHVQGRKPRVSAETRVESNRVVLTVEDNGPGVSRQMAEVIFESFYTTKTRERAAGLGLKICRDVVSGHGGHIEVASTPGAGATFRVYLPRAQSAEHRKAETLAPPRQEQPPTQPELPRARLRHILLVDDDEVLARALKRALRPHEVRIAASGEDARAILAEPGYEPDAVLCDLRLPGMSGTELHERTKADDPALASRFAFITGGAFSEEHSKYLRESGLPTLLKPISVHDVLTLLDAMSKGARAGDSIPTLEADAS